MRDVKVKYYSVVEDLENGSMHVQGHVSSDHALEYMRGLEEINAEPVIVYYSDDDWYSWKGCKVQEERAERAVSHVRKLLASPDVKIS